MNKIIDFVKSKGVQENDIKTDNYSMSPRYQNFDCSSPVSLPMPPVPEGTDAASIAGVPSAPKICPPPQIVGYTISQTLTVKVRDFKVVGDILSGATAQGANSVSGPNFDVDDMTQYEKEARDKAISKAKDKAQSMAQSAGFTLGRLISISDYSNNPSYADMGFGKGGAVESAAAPAPQVQPGTQRITINVNLTYEIK